MRDPHEPVIPGRHQHPKEGHGGVSMPIGVSGDYDDPHEPVLPEGMKQKEVKKKSKTLMEKVLGDKF